MILWRISEHATLNGAGGLVVGGRWHSKGRPIVYAAESAALAMLEVLVHLEVDSIPPPFQLMRIQVADGLPHSVWPNSARSDLSSETAEWGDAWLARGDAALARVPSAIAPDSFNWLINPLHSAARQIVITAASRWPWDERLFSGRPG